MEKRKFTLKSLLIASLLLLGLSSCSEDMIYEGATNEQQTSTLTINTRGIGNKEEGTEDENKVGTLRAIVYKVNLNKADGSISYGEQLVNNYYTNNPKTITVIFPKQDNVRVLLIANERSAWNLEDTEKTANDIKNLSVEYGDPKEYTTISTPIIMFGESETLDGTINNFTTISLERNVARVDLYLSCLYKNIATLNNGTITLRAASIQRMARTSGLATPQQGLDIADDFLTGADLKFEEGKNYNSTETGFSIGSTDKDYVTFYIPECYITDTQAYTYIYITGEYKTNSGITTLLAYSLPIGKSITAEKINNPALFTKEDLNVQRNSIYEMKVVIKSLQQINEVYVDVKKWNEKEVDGSIETPKPSKLNISNIYPTLEVENDITLVQFWSDQTSDKISILPTGTIKESKQTFNVNDIFIGLIKEKGTEKPENIEYEINGEKWGHLSLVFQKAAATAGNTYIITLDAAGLQRTIEVKAVAKEVKSTESSNEQIII